MKNPIKHLHMIVVLTFVFVVFALVGPCPCEAGRWKTEVIGPNYCGHHAIALDNSANPHIIYVDCMGSENHSDSVFRHAFFEGLEWKTEVVDSGDVGWRPSIKVDSLDHIHVSYIAGNSLVYVFFDGTSWKKTIVESGGAGSSIALDANNRPHISHMTLGGELEYVHHDGSNWVTETIAGDAYIYGATSLALTPLGAAYISFSKNWTLGYPLYLAKNISGSWEVTEVGNNATESSLALDSLGNPHIVFIRGCCQLVYTRFNGTDWITESEDLPAGVFRPSIALDRFDHAHMSFGAAAEYGSKYYLLYAHHTGKDWLFSLVAKMAGNSMTSNLSSYDP